MAILTREDEHKIIQSTVDEVRRLYPNVPRIMAEKLARKALAKLKRKRE